MSKYTTGLRFICEQLASESDSKGYNDVNTIIEKAREKIFSFHYDIFSSKYKKILETNILKNFYLREIAFETVGIFKLKLENKMQQIMPYYNKLYLSQDLVTEPLKDFSRSHNTSRTDDTSATESNEGTSNTNMTNATTSNTTSNVSSENKSESVAEKKNRYSDTPQGGLSGIDDNTYLTNASVDNSSERNNANASEKNITDETLNNTQTVANTNSNDKTLTNKLTSVFEELESGNNQSQSELLLKYRETFINIDMMIINDLEELFLQIW